MTQREKLNGLLRWIRLMLAKVTIEVTVSVSLAKQIECDSDEGLTAADMKTRCFS